VSTVPSDELTKLFEVPFTFVERPQPVPGVLRPGWRIPTVLMLIRKCWGSRASLEQLHVLNWAIRDPAARDTFLGFWRGEVDPDEAVVRYEPALNRAIDLAVGLHLLDWTGARRLALTDEGRELLAEIDQDEDVLAEEKEFLGEFTSPITQAGVQMLLGKKA
jgi:hypothetical protein